MPTGYTSCVQDGTVNDLRPFALRCARAFGACIHQRDDNTTDVPKHREVCEYTARRVIELENDIYDLERMTVAECRAAAEKQYQDDLKYHDRIHAKRAEGRARYSAMLAKVKSWEPPTPAHVELRDFMERQLIDSIKWDCSGDWPSLPEQVTAADWNKAKLAAAKSNLESAKKALAEESARCESANNWIDALVDSLNERST